jgi:membrane fusion protein (multidrug efflux system)
VTTGEARDGNVAIASGLSAGEEVVTTGQLKINPGGRIRIDNAQTLQRSGPLPKQ